MEWPGSEQKAVSTVLSRDPFWSVALHPVEMCYSLYFQELLSSSESDLLWRTCVDVFSLLPLK